MEVIVNKSPGSSPHVRGALRILTGIRELHGIIPTCAGSTVMLLYICSRQRDHPRMCGEHLMKNLSLILDVGSSPHVRGALHDGG